jgi:hypothetical protein
MLIIQDECPSFSGGPQQQEEAMPPEDQKDNSKGKRNNKMEELELAPASDLTNKAPL